MIQIAKTIYQKTNGCYDPTIGPLFDLWGFKQDVLHVPTQQQIEATKVDLGMNKIDVDRTGKRIRKMVPKLQIDFSSMGEGYTIGKLSHILESKGITNYLVEFGGDMKIQGHKPDGSKWRIAIESPVPSKDGAVPYQIMTVNDETGVTLDTSGTYRHHFDKNGKRYSHILNPRTGKPVTHDLVSASVFGTDSRVSDAWATAMLCLGSCRRR
ncbi:FAD:protein FMN transferase [Vibrio sp. PP-XX7]